MSKQKRAIVLIHGFRGTHHGLSLIARDLSHDFECFVPDIPGFGKGQELPTYSMDEYVEWLKDYIGNLKTDKPPILLGHSFGSMITSAFADKYPDKTSKLILLNPVGAPALEGLRWLPTQIALLHFRVGNMLNEKLARAWLSFPLIVYIMSVVTAKTHKKSLRRYIHQQHFKYFSRFITPKSLYLSFQTSINHSVRDYAKNIKNPCLLIAGELDEITPIHKQLELQKMIKNSRIVIIPGVGHLTHYETPKEVCSAIREWLEN